MRVEGIINFYLQRWCQSHAHLNHLYAIMSAKVRA